MIRNYFLIALRNIKRHRSYSIINISGLAIGMTCCILIMLWVQDELSFDRYHENADRIYRFCLEGEVGSHLKTMATMAPAAPALVSEYPEVVNATRIDRPRSVSVKYEDRLFQEEGIGYADNSIFEIFTYPFVSGDPKSALTTAYSVVIAREMAEKYFGGVDPLGKILTIDGDREYTVTGVIENIPKNSHLRFNMIRSFETLYAENEEGLENWFDIHYLTYLLLAENSDYRELEQKFPALVDKQLGPALEATGGTLEFFLQPLTSIHLHSHMGNEISVNGDVTYVYLFTGIAIFVLLIACVNFVNLSTARAANRAMEVGVRKTFGATRRQLIRQFLGEAILFSVLGVILAVILLELTLPVFNNFTDREMSLNYLQSPWIFLVYLGFAILVGLIAGSYPSFHLSSFQPSAVLKGELKGGPAKSRLRRTLVVAQFTITITLIIGTLIIYDQINFMKNTKLGFDKEQVVVIPRINDAIRKSYRSIRNELLNLPGIIDVSASSLVPSRGNLISIFQPEGFSDNQLQQMDYLDVDYNYITMMNMEIVAGRNFSSELSTDSTESVLINETAARKFGWDDPIGKTFVFSPPPGVEGETTVMNVVGVIGDFHKTSLHKEIEPLIVFYNPGNMNFISIRIDPRDIDRTLDSLEDKWRGIDPQRPFDYFFLDESINRLYQAEEKVVNIALYFSLFAIFIACLGLYGMSSFAAERRTKEIGIRKTLGATIAGIVQLLSKESIVLVAIANLIAWPLAYYSMDRWLENFPYRVGVGIHLFVLAGLAALIIALTTVSYQAIKAARANPVDSLRYE